MDDRPADRSGALARALDAYVAGDGTEAHDVGRMQAALRTGDPWVRAAPLHVTGSALVVHPASQRVLLRWHERMQRWLQVGGHIDADDADPFAAAMREAVEETGLTDLRPWPDPDHPTLLHVAVVPVPATGGEPAHEHGDLRYLLATDHPDDVVPESPGARLRWLPFDEAGALVADDNVRITLRRAESLVAGW